MWFCCSGIYNICCKMLERIRGVFRILSNIDVWPASKYACPNWKKKGSVGREWLRQKQPPELFYKKGVLKNLAKFTGKHLCWSFFFKKVAGLSLQHRCFPVNFAKFLRTLYRTPPGDCICMRSFSRLKKPIKKLFYFKQSLQNNVTKRTWVFIFVLFPPNIHIFFKIEFNMLKIA